MVGAARGRPSSRSRSPSPDRRGPRASRRPRSPSAKEKRRPMPKNDGLDPDRRRLRKLLKDFRVAMLTTVTPDGVLRSRPMATVRMEGDGDIWFLTRAGTPKVGEVEEHRQVNVGYVSAKGCRYLSLSGTATVVADAARLQAMWKKRHRKWF